MTECIRTVVIMETPCRHGWCGSRLSEYIGRLVLEAIEQPRKPVPPDLLAKLDEYTKPEENG